jgi:7-cyano-7-deazaguanine synthase
MAKKALLLLSGGIDSTTTLALAQKEGFKTYALTFHYNQRHSQEVECASRIARFMGVTRHLVLNIDLSSIGGSALTAGLEVPKERPFQEIGKGIPLTYVPARNTIFLSYALAWAEVLGIGDIFLGVNARDYSGYPDCRPAYIEAFEKMANLGTKAGVEGKGFKIRAPLINLTKAEIIKKGLSLKVDYSLTWSCYDPTPRREACGKCDSCQLRLKAFKEVGAKDPLTYA